MIVWKAVTVSPRMASFRYRVANPAICLERRGLRVRFAWHPRLTLLRGADTLILSKTFAAGDLALARRAQRLGIPVIYDLCDNVFVDGYHARARAIVAQLADLANVVVASTASLAQVLAEHVRDKEKIVVVPDPVERREDLQAIVSRFRLAAIVEKLIRTAYGVLNSMLSAARFFAKLATGRTGWRAVRAGRAADAQPTDDAASPHFGCDDRGDRNTRPVRSVGPVRIITWFGNHGGDFADFGMLDILLVSPALEAIAERRPITLRVVSNNRAKFKRHIAPLRVATEYVEWSPETAHELVSASDVVIIPGSLNDFTRCKSANRLLLSLQCGVPVVTARSPANAEFDAFVLFDDWQENIERYLDDRALREEHLARAAALIERRYLPERIADEWQGAIAEAKRRNALVRQELTAGTQLVLLVNLVQDLELILPLYARAKQRPEWRTEIWVTTHDLLGRAEMWKRLKAADVPYQVVETRYAESGGFPEWNGVAALISASESTASPHRHALRTVRTARRHGVRTYTLQHGFQNVGLTYGDETFPVKGVRFASDVIFLWGTLESLHPDVRQETRRRCVPAGCPKPAEGPAHELPRRFAEPVVAVFENLHSPRYGSGYAERFLDDLMRTMKQRPDLRFLIKPHPAGQYLTTRHGEPFPLPDNAIIVDPRAREWVNVSAADVLASAAAVITSVTTVAFDAARFGKPVGIVTAGYTRDLAAFSPLTQLRGQDDWSRFLQLAVDARDAHLTEVSRTFARKTALEGDAIGRILDHIARDLSSRRGDDSTDAAGE